MPVILPDEHHVAWLSGEAGKEILLPFPAGRMRAWPIDARVNSPRTGVRQWWLTAHAGTFEGAGGQIPCSFDATLAKIVW